MLSSFSISCHVLWHLEQIKTFTLIYVHDYSHVLLSTKDKRVVLFYFFLADSLRLTQFILRFFLQMLSGNLFYKLLSSLLSNMAKITEELQHKVNMKNINKSQIYERMSSKILLYFAISFLKKRLAISQF